MPATEPDPAGLAAAGTTAANSPWEFQRREVPAVDVLQPARPGAFTATLGLGALIFAVDRLPSRRLER